MDFNQILERLIEAKQDTIFNDVVKDWAENESHIRWVMSKSAIAKVKKDCKADKDWEKADTVNKMELLIGKYVPEE